MINIAKDKSKLKILQLTDLHFSDGDESDKKTTSLVNAVITETKPDLIFLTGDFLTCEKNVETAESSLKCVYKHKIPWVYVYGNHDTEYGKGYKEMNEKLMQLPYNINPKTAENIAGHSNFCLSFGDNSQWLIIGLDSGAYNENPLLGGYDFVKSNQIEWYKNILNKRKEQDDNFAALCFLHMPFPEYNEALKSESFFGNYKEKVCCPKQNSGLFSAMLETGHTRGVFAGHDHINDYEAELYGISLCYGRASGYSTYGRRGFKRGARLITIDKNDTKGFYTTCILKGKKLEIQQERYRG